MHVEVLEDFLGKSRGGSSQVVLLLFDDHQHQELFDCLGHNNRIICRDAEMLRCWMGLKFAVE